MNTMLKIFLAGALAFPFASYAVEPEESDSVGGFRFTDINVIKTVPVKDQNKSGTCWCFASTTFFEDEILRKSGRELDLSEMFTVYHCYNDKADRFVRLYGQTNFAGGGSTNDVPYVWKKYGVVPESIYNGIRYGEDKHVHGELDAILSAYVKSVVSNPNRRISTAWKKGYEGVLDAYLGELPETFVIDGVTYTPQTYAASLPIDVDDYVSYTSFSHHPFYEEFAVEVPDNWLWGKSVNVPLDEMQAIVDNAIEKGYPVVWAADVSEDGFNWKKGYAVIPKPTDEADLEGSELARWVTLSDADRKKERYKVNGPADEIEVTQEVRQEMFDRQETTDDHGMEIVGIATDQEGNRYYKVKNSWDTNQVYGGFFYVSMPYFRAKTINIYLNKEAVPADIARKSQSRRQ